MISPSNAYNCAAAPATALRAQLLSTAPAAAPAAALAQPTPVRGHELALERLLPEEQPPEMLLLIESLQAAEKAAAELQQANAILRQHPLPPHAPLESLSSGKRLSLLKALDTSPAAPALFKVPHAHAAPLATMHRRCGRAY